MNLSKHFIANPQLYEESIYKSFEQFIGKPEDLFFSDFAKLSGKTKLFIDLYGRLSDEKIRQT
jgi:hypothetical protein